MTAWLLAGLVVGTFVSEDLTCVLAGLLILDGRVEPISAIAACALGIWIGDLGLWAAGRLAGPRVLAWPRLRRHVTAERAATFAQWFDSHAAPALLASRLLPGTRLPLYVAAGALGGPFRPFAVGSLVARRLGKPPVVLL